MKQKSTDLRSQTPEGVADDIRSAWEDDGNEPAIPRFPIPGPRRSDESGRTPQPRREQRFVLVAD